MSAPRLTVHRNNRDQRRAKDRRVTLRKTVGNMLRDIPDPEGFAIVVWDKQFNACVDWRTDQLPGAVVPEFVKVTMQKGQTSMQIDEALRGPVPPEDDGA